MPRLHHGQNDGFALRGQLLSDFIGRQPPVQVPPIRYGPRGCTVRISAMK